MRILRHIAACAALLLAAATATAQNVYFSPKFGKTIMAETPDGEVGAQYGFFSMWRHDQLPLTVTASDYKTLNKSGEMMLPAANMHVCGANDAQKFVLLGNYGGGTYISMSLPIGYRFTGYRMQLERLDNSDIDGGKYNGVQPVYTNDDVTVTERSSDFAKEKTRVTIAANGSNVLERTSLNKGEDMGHHLYFYIENKNEDGTHTCTAVVVKSCVIYFTAEGDETLWVRPYVVDPETGKSHRESPFSTGRMDLGEFHEYEYNKKTHASTTAYTAAQATALKADCHIYNEAAVSNGNIPGEDETGVDETHQTITSVLNEDLYWYGLKSGTYFVETPVKSQGGEQRALPIGMRITGAKIHYTRGSQADEMQNVGHLITYQKDASSPKYYLNADGRFTSDRGSAVTWRNDEPVTCKDSKVVYCLHSTAGTYLVAVFMYGIPYLATVTDPDEIVNNLVHPVEHDNKEGCYIKIYDSVIYYEDKGKQDVTKNYYLYVDDTAVTNSITFVDEDDRQRYYDYEHNRMCLRNLGTRTLCISYEQMSMPAFTPGDFTIKLYDQKTGEYLEGQDITVNESNPTGEIVLGDLNNDAIKFEIVATGDVRALVRVKLTVQALNPYMNGTKVVCTTQNSAGEQKRVTQIFSVDDFRLFGDQFTIHAPQSYINDGVKGTITFENLYNRYSDGHYGEQGGHARYSYVKSPYMNALYPGTGTGLYDTSLYDPDATYTDKVKQIVCADKMFYCNNLDKLETGKQFDETQKYYREFPYTENSSGQFKYLDKTTSPGIVTETGTHSQLTLTANGDYEDRALFTTDETRYNIAPTWATEHRYHAYYAMKLRLVAKEFEPVFTWRKIYPETFYQDTDGTERTNAKYGLKVEIEPWKDTDDKWSTAGALEASVIAEEIRRVKDPTKPEDENATSDTGDILYIDVSSLNNLIYYEKMSDAPGGIALPTEHQAMDELTYYNKVKLAPNSLVYLPQNMAVYNDNFAYKTSQGSYRACHDIVLTDKRPFFAPHRIQLPAASKVEYQRKITVPKNGQVTAATVLLPFNISLEGGVHKDPTGSEFTVAEMQQSGSVSAQTKTAQEQTCYFTQKWEHDGLTSTLPNTPYMVNVKTLPTDNSTSFIVRQTGATIAASELDEAADVKSLQVMNTDHTFSGETATSTVTYADNTSAALTFHCYASFAGQQLPKGGGNIMVDGEATTCDGYFYFAENKLRNSTDLTFYPSVYMYPFRAYYAYSTPSPAAAARLRSMAVAFGENPNPGHTTAISTVKSDAEPAFRVTASRRSVTVTATTACHVTVCCADGRQAASLSLRGGETRTVALPSGVYVIGGRKLTVM